MYGTAVKTQQGLTAYKLEASQYENLLYLNIENLQTRKCNGKNKPSLDQQPTYCLKL